MWFLVNQFFWKVLEFWRTSSSTTILLWNVELVKEKDLVPQIFCSNSILIEKYIRFLSSILASTSTTLSWESWENILDVDDDDVHEATHDEAPIGIAQPPKNLSQPIHRFSSLDGYTFFDFYRCFVRFLGVFYFWKPWIIIPSTYHSLLSFWMQEGWNEMKLTPTEKYVGHFGGKNVPQHKATTSI